MLTQELLLKRADNLETPIDAIKLVTTLRLAFKQGVDFDMALKRIENSAYIYFSINADKVVKIHGTEIARESVHTSTRKRTTSRTYTLHDIVMAISIFCLEIKAVKIQDELVIDLLSEVKQELTHKLGYGIYDIYVTEPMYNILSLLYSLFGQYYWHYAQTLKYQYLIELRA